MLQLVVIFGLAMLAIAWFAGEPILVGYRRWTVGRRPFPEAWREILRRRVPISAAAPRICSSSSRSAFRSFSARSRDRLRRAGRHR